MGRERLAGHYEQTLGCLVGGTATGKRMGQENIPVIHCHPRKYGTSYHCKNLKTHSCWLVLKLCVSACLTVALAWDSGDGLVEGMCVCVCIVRVLYRPRRDVN